MDEKEHAATHTNDRRRTRNMGKTRTTGGGTKAPDTELGGGDSNGKVVSGDGRGAELTHISLFTGIGGFDLAAEWAGFRTIAMCEIDPFCQEVLKARFGAVADARDEGLPGSEWPGAHSESGTPAHRPTTERHPLLIPDIRDFDGTRFRGATLLTGGFPCQPFSHAGKREGRNDKQGRHLWPEMLRVIAESRPRWCIAENVPGLISIEDGVVFEQVCTDLEGEGYEVQAFIIPACAVNAPHRRDRVWICAHNTQDALDGGNGGRGDGDTTRLRRALQTARPDSDADHAKCERQPGCSCGATPESHSHGAHNGLPITPDSDAPDASRLHGDGRDHYLRVGSRGKQVPESGNGAWTRDFAPRWDIPWIDIAIATCNGRVDDGLPAWIHSRRVARLKALGNAVVPQVPAIICSYIAEIEKNT